MKLKEPLQGIKLVQGHIAMNFAMFSMAFCINTDTSKVTSIDAD